jgi:hypothetical protein
MSFKKIFLCSFAAMGLAAGAAQAQAEEFVEEGLSIQSNTQHDVMKCESLDYRYGTCYTGYEIDYVTVQQQLSRANCIEGQTWGRGSNFIWVDHGCRALFRVVRRPVPTEIECNSLDFKYASCFVGAQIRSVELARQLSRASCVYGRSWGYGYDSIWVDRGCRARFRVYR